MAKLSTYLQCRPIDLLNNAMTKLTTMCSLQWQIVCRQQAYCTSMRLLQQFKTVNASNPTDYERQHLHIESLARHLEDRHQMYC